MARSPRAPLDQGKGQKDRRAPTRERKGRGGPALGAGAQRQPPDQRAERDRGQCRAGKVERRGVGVAQGRHDAPGEPDRARGERQVDEEDRAPESYVHEPAADDGAHRPGSGPRRGPDADRAPLGGARESLAQDGEARGHKKRRAHALKQAPEKEQAKVGREGAGQRGQPEQRRASDQRALPPPPVARRAAHKQERAERQEVGVDDPLQASGARAEAFADGGQAHVDHRAVDEGQRRGEDRGGQHEAGMRDGALALGMGQGRVAGCVEGCAHFGCPPLGQIISALPGVARAVAPPRPRLCR
jgi:hypothetical protein